MPSFATHCTFLATLLLLPSFPILAQAVAPPATPPAEPADPLDAGEDRIVVTANRDRGGVVGDVAPELQLDARDVRALGVSNLAELLAELAPQTRSGAGRGNGGPVVLLNGRRISGFSEIRDLPPEAIERVDVLPEEVALR